jgi:hypothetical protein
MKKFDKEVEKELNVGSSCTEVNNSRTVLSSHSARRGSKRRLCMRSLLYNSADQLHRRFVKQLITTGVQSHQINFRTKKFTEDNFNLVIK